MTKKKTLVSSIGALMMMPTDNKGGFALVRPEAVAYVIATAPLAAVPNSFNQSLIGVAGLGTVTVLGTPEQVGAILAGDDSIDPTKPTSAPADAE